MAKAKKQINSAVSGAKAAPPAAASPPSPAKPSTKKTSEIDDIFNSKPKPKGVAASETETPAAAPAGSTSSKKANKKKRKAAEAEAETDKDVPAAPSKPTTAASGVKVVEFSEMDTSKTAASAPVAAGTEPAAKKRKVESMDEFLGNNGKKRFTDDGYPLYYMEDLLAQEGGDTDLCPFECECCF